MLTGLVVMNGFVRHARYPGDTPEDRSDRSLDQRASIRTSSRARRLASFMSICSVVCAMTAGVVAGMTTGPAYGEPGTGNVPSTADSTMPDTGARPVPAGALAGPAGVLTAPGGGTPTAPTGVPAPPVLGPLAIQITNAQRAVEALGEQLKQADLDLTAAHDDTTRAAADQQMATDRMAALRAEADSVAAEAYKRAAALGPYASYADTLHQLSVLAPALGLQPGGPSAAYEVDRAEQAARTTEAAYLTAQHNETAVQSRRDTLKQSFDQQSAALNELTTRNAAQLPQIEAQRNAYEQSLGGTNLASTSIDGKAANPKALQAVQFALAQQGKPYVWATEGPDTYDCSGLVWAAYRSLTPPYTLPRVASDQYHSTRAINPTSTTRGDLLIPGDLLYFATDPNDWTSIHHVGMYIGGGRMVHAPSTGQVVQISPVWWSEFFGATRIFDPVPAPAVTTPAGPRPTPTPTPAPKPPPATTAAPTPTGQPSATPSTAPAPSPTADPTSPPPTSPPPSSPPPSSPTDPPEPSTPPSRSTSSSTPTSDSVDASPSQ